MAGLLRSALRAAYCAGPHQCSCCGHYTRFVQHDVIPHELARQWELTPELWERMNRREGQLCRSCGSNGRARLLAKVLLERVAVKLGRTFSSVATMADQGLGGTRIAEINHVAGLHPFLARLSGLAYSEYGSPDADVPHEDLSALTYPDGSFDFVLTSDTLEHVPDFDGALREIFRVLKPGGEHIFTIPVIWERQTRQRAELIDGELRLLLGGSYHGVQQRDWMVVNEFGGDVLDRIGAAGFRTSVVKDSRNDVVSVIVATRPA